METKTMVQLFAGIAATALLIMMIIDYYEVRGYKELCKGFNAWVVKNPYLARRLVESNFTLLNTTSINPEELNTSKIMEEIK